VTDDKGLLPTQRLELQRYINRLGIAKKRAEKKITDLGGEYGVTFSSLLFFFETR